MSAIIQVPIDIDPNIRRVFIQIAEKLNNSLSIEEGKEILAYIEANEPLIQHSEAGIPTVHSESTIGELAEAINEIAQVLQETKILR